MNLPLLRLQEKVLFHSRKWPFSRNKKQWKFIVISAQYQGHHERSLLRFHNVPTSRSGRGGLPLTRTPRFGSHSLKCNTWITLLVVTAPLHWQISKCFSTPSNQILQLLHRKELQWIWTILREKKFKTLALRCNSMEISGFFVSTSKRIQLIFQLSKFKEVLVRIWTSQLQLLVQL